MQQILRTQQSTETPESNSASNVNSWNGAIKNQAHADAAA